MPGARLSAHDGSQNSLSRPTRCSGALPAMIALLMAPMEMPANQLGCDAGLVQALVNAGLVGAERPAALQHQGHGFVSGKGEGLRHGGSLYEVPAVAS